MPTPDLAAEILSIRRITMWGMLVNIFLAIIKGVVGWIIHSLSLIADAFNSLSDIVTDIAVIWGSHWGSRPPDENHPFGHGKIETFISGVVIIGIIVVGAGVIVAAVQSLLGFVRAPLSGSMIMIIAGATIIVKELLYHKTLKVARIVRSTALKAKAWDHRGDVAVALVVLMGGLGTILKIQFADAVAGLIVGIIVLSVGFRLGKEVIVELSEGAADRETLEQLNRVMASIPEIRGWHKLRTRRIGRQLHLDVHILLNPRLTVEEAHNIVRNIEDTLRSATNWPIDPLVHVDPDNDEIRSKR
ncbi:MAG: cation diffusion facilitator family transporter, partial [bacterium]